MDVRTLLEAAALLVPEGTATGNDITVADVWDYLAHDAWDVALGLLEELGDAGPLPYEFWAALAAAAEQCGAARSTAWCHWRAGEARHGIVRAELGLRPAGETWRTTAVPGAGVLRPMWDLGARTPDGRPVLHVARLWVEARTELEPGGRAAVRLAPLEPAYWRNLRPGQEIGMYEGRSVGGTATILEVRPPGTP